MFFFWISLLIIFTSVGLGLPYGIELSYLLIISLPFFLFFKDFRNKKQILLPTQLTKLFFVFFFFSFLSLVTSVNIYKSFEYYLLYLACFLVLTYTNNKKGEVLKKLFPFILFVSFIYCTYTVLITYFTNLIPTTGKQLVFAIYGSHNHLGDFLVLTLILLFYFLNTKGHKIITLLSIFLFLPFFIFSYSRSAYLDLSIILIIYAITLFKSKISINLKIVSSIIFVFTIMVSGVLFFAIPKDINIYKTNQIRQYLTLNQSLSDKFFLGGRENYLEQAINSAVEKPLLGVGPGNFLYSSLKFGDPLTITSYSHNIFIDIFIENGIIAGLIFVVIIIVCIKRSKTSIITFLTLALLLNFQTDYSYAILPLLLTFFIFLGIGYEEKKYIKTGKFLLIVSIILLASSLLIIANNLYIKVKNIPQSCPAPINKTIFDPTLLSYLILAKGDPKLILCQAQIYEDQNNKMKALYYYHLAYEAGFTQGYLLGPKIYDLKLEINGDKSASDFLKTYLKKLSTTKNVLISVSFNKKVSILCTKAYNNKCPYKF